jgi:hypothetical protein
MRHTPRHALRVCVHARARRSAERARRGMHGDVGPAVKADFARVGDERDARPCDAFDREDRALDDPHARRARHALDFQEDLGDGGRRAATTGTAPTTSVPTSASTLVPTSAGAMNGAASAGRLVRLGVVAAENAGTSKS